jgi:hypothetical protein
MTTLLLAEFIRPERTDLWAFYVLAGTWTLIFAFVWVGFRWLRDHHEGEGHRGL